MSDFDIRDGVLVWYTGNETEVVIPDGVTSIGEYAFEGRRGLIRIDIPNSVTTSTGYLALYPFTRLTRIDIPNSVTSIGYMAFKICTGLAEVIIPSSVTSISDFAFSGCTGLTKAVIPNSVKSIGIGAFNDCTGLTRIEIPDSVTSIGFGAFKWCTSLTEVVIPEGCVLGIDVFERCNALETIVISESDIGRLSRPGIFPKPLDEYNIIIKKSGQAVWQLSTKNKAEYSGEAIEICRHFRGLGLTRVMVRFLIPVCCYSLGQAYSKLPFITRQEVYNLILGAIRVVIPLEPRELM